MTINKDAKRKDNSDDNISFELLEVILKDEPKTKEIDVSLSELLLLLLKKKDGTTIPAKDKKDPISEKPTVVSPSTTSFDVASNKTKEHGRRQKREERQKRRKQTT